MKLQFKHQPFQADAAKAVADVFIGQPYLGPSLMTDGGRGLDRRAMTESRDFAGCPNAGIVPGLSDEIILRNLNQIQNHNQIPPSPKLEGRFNLTVEMETGVGKTYTYIKTMYELNMRYGWSKFIVVVPSIAVREGVYKSFQVTQEHFAEEYGRKIRFFIYNSARLKEIEHFASDGFMNVMIINSQAFNAKGKDARRIYMRLDEFRSRRPIDVIAKTRPIVIIDEPQSVEGRQTKENLKQFHPLMTLRYSATHKAEGIYNMVYRLDGLEAYRKRLVKKIAVKGITETGTAATHSFVYLESVNLSKADPTATIQFDFKDAAGIRRKTQKAGIGFNLYDHSGELSEYRDGFVVKSIDGRDNSIEFVNGIKLFAGDVTGEAGEEQIRRIQIRETILSHIERERQLFYRGIKVLSLFFIDQVAHYKEYDQAGQPGNGIFARMFEEEYQDVIDRLQPEAGDDDYMRYLASIPASHTHAGYFSVDKKGHFTDRIAGDDRKSMVSNDIAAYDLIMKNKELLLERDPEKSPVRFLFSHSALREGWDNPNVFQICTLKQSGSEVRKRQEVGRGLRLCVNQEGERMDADVLGTEVHDVNVLTVIASESYDSFAKGLQAELAEAAAQEPKALHGAMMPENARGNNIELQVDRKKLASKEFQDMWSKISAKSAYAVGFDADELAGKAAASLNESLRISKTSFTVETGLMNDVKSGEELLGGRTMIRESSVNYEGRMGAVCGRSVKYDLVGRLVEETGLTRKSVVQILAGMEKAVFDQFKENPEEFILKAAALINDQKAAAVIEHVTYHALEERYDTEIFTKPAIKARLGLNAMRADKHLYDHVVYGSMKEKAFAEELEKAHEVAVYVKLPVGFYISTPVGNYNPDWAIAFREGAVKHICFVAETKGNRNSMRWRAMEEAKIHCAREHFKVMGNENVVYDVVDDFESLMCRVMEERKRKTVQTVPPDCGTD